MAGAKAKFAALPLRAIADQRLSGLELRTLACIAWHDRMSAATGKGQGAWASNATMAVRLGCHLTNLSSAITRLAKLGYITREQHHFDKRKHVYRVVYEADDSLPDDKLNGLPHDQLPTDDSLPDDKRPAEIVCPPPEKSLQFQSDAEGNIFRETVGRYSAEAVKEIPHKRRVAVATRIASSAPRFVDGEPIHESLAKFERWFKADAASISNLSDWETWLQTQSEDLLDEDEAAAYRAQRLAEDVSAWRWEHGQGAEL